MTSKIHLQKKLNKQRNAYSQPKKTFSTEVQLLHPKVPMESVWMDLRHQASITSVNSISLRVSHLNREPDYETVSHCRLLISSVWRGWPTSYAAITIASVASASQSRLAIIRLLSSLAARKQKSWRTMSKLGKQQSVQVYPFLWTNYLLYLKSA